MGRYFLFILLVFFSYPPSVSAASKDTKKAEKYFQTGDYTRAIEEYTLLIESESDLPTRAGYRFRVGECYSRLNRPDRAEKSFTDAIKSGYMSASAYLALGEVQLKLGKYDDALSSFESYKLANPSDPLGDVRIASCQFARENEHHISLFEIKRLDAVNSRQSEFGVSYFNESLLFSSTRAAASSKENDDEVEDDRDRESNRFDDRVIPEKKGKDKAYTKSGLNETRIMYAVGNNGKYNRPLEITELNKMKDFADDGVMLYDPYSRQGLYTHRDGKKEYIYQMILKNNKWEKSGRIEVQSQGEPIGHPFMIPSGDRIYFTSTMPGGKGKSDIWYITKTGTDSWSPPVNAGDNVNTAGNEVYPHIAGDYLFFASDGRIGFGGFDIYAAKMENGVPQRAVNLGSPFNSSGDDYNLVMRADLKEGVLTTNRSVRTADDIYRFAGFPSYVTATGQVMDLNTKRPISNVSLELFLETKSLGKTMSDEHGGFLIPISPKTTYTLKATVAGYAPAEKVFTSSGELFGRVNKENGIDLDFLIGSNASFISGRVQDRRTAVPLDGEVVSLIEDGKVVQTVRTDPSGIYKFSNLKSNTKYFVKADPKGYFSDSKEITTGDVAQKREYSKQNGVDMDLALESFELNKEVTISKIAFQDGKANLVLSESQKELDRLAGIFAKNQHLDISLAGYVDTRTSSKIANELSLRRVNAIRDYLISKKVNPARLSSRAMGRSRPLINNPKTEEEHQKNNRITYTVTRINEELMMGGQSTTTGGKTTTDNKSVVSSGTSTASSNKSATGMSSSGATATETTTAKPSTSSQVNAAEQPFRVQIAAFRSLDLKRKEFIKIKVELGYDIRYELGVDGMYRYYVGGFPNRTEAQDVLTKIKGIGIDGIIAIKK